MYALVSATLLFGLSFLRACKSLLTTSMPNLQTRWRLKDMEYQLHLSNNKDKRHRAMLSCVILKCYAYQKQCKLCVQAWQKWRMLVWEQARTERMANFAESADGQWHKERACQQREFKNLIMCLFVSRFVNRSLAMAWQRWHRNVLALQADAAAAEGSLQMQRCRVRAFVSRFVNRSLAMAWQRWRNFCQNFALALHATVSLLQVYTALVL